jgi:hypothetical protein
MMQGERSLHVSPYEPYGPPYSLVIVPHVKVNVVLIVTFAPCHCKQASIC